VAAMQLLADWLKKLGMSEYAERFAENDIDMAVLPDLTDQHLKDLGVSLGHRLKMLRAIRDLGGPPSDLAAPSVSEPARREDAERRQLTVMFTDLVGSTALSTKLDPEDMRSVIGAYHKCVAETVARFDGFVAKYMGDGVLIYFGYPHAHEDDAERAVRTGLALVEAVGTLGVQEPLQVRIGVATGLVVVGDIVGSGEAQERGVVGETPNLAARLQGVAAPNTVVIAEGTRRLIGNLFELGELGPVALKGIVGSVRAWAALRASFVESRFEALHSTGLTALVGREEETELLLRRWARAKTGEGQAVLIAGEAGIGKSRLTAALLERLGTEPHARLRYFCSPQHTDSAFYPIIGQMERAAGLGHDDTPQARLDKLDAVLARTSTSIEDVALFAEMLSLANDGRYPALDLLPQQRRQRTLEALTTHTEALTRQSPVLMIFEDAHWTDPTSLELFDRTVDRIANLRVLLIVTFRPEFEPPWIGRPHVTALTINRLALRDIDTMIDRIAADTSLPVGIRQDIIERTDGIPLFVEEMTKAVLEAGDEDAARQAAAVPSPARAVPASLHASLMARLDRLGSAKETAQIGAAIGREFSHALLAAVGRKPEAELEMALERLIQSGLLFRQGVPPHARYLFKHALVQDTAYGTLLREPRRALHARIAEALETEFPEIAESQPELLARHCTEAGLVEKATGLWGKAGQRSLARSALVEAAEQLARALAGSATLLGTPALRREQIKHQVALANILMHTKGWTAPETRAAVEQARLFMERTEALGEPPEDPLVLFSVLYGVLVPNLLAFNGDVCRDLATQFLALAETRGTTAARVVGHRMLGLTLFCSGELEQARAQYNQALNLHDPAVHRPLAARFGQDTEGTALSYRAWASWMLGYPEAAARDAECAVKSARECGHAPTLLYALAVSPVIHMERGDYVTAKARNDELMVLAEEKGALIRKASAMTMRGRLMMHSGKIAEAARLMSAGVTAWSSTGTTLHLSHHLSFLAKVHAELDQYDEAWRCLGEAMRSIETTKEKVFEAEVNRIGGEIALKSPARDVAKAAGYFESALVVARSQRAKSLELRAAMSLARLWRDQGKRQQAHDLLAPVFGWFTEGFDTLDLKQAKTLLDQLA
jgi:class 3 adenylate cyclase/predicted ATPase